MADYQQLVAGVTPGTEIHVLDPAQDAVTQITNILLGRQNIASLHVVSHGEAGGLDFGSSALNLIDLPQYAAQLKTWSKALTNDADILFYGCNVAEGAVGQRFVQSISQLTGADVAASDDLTGSAALGGNWNLEFNTGKIESSLAFKPDEMQAYKAVLPALFDSLTPAQSLISRAAEFNFGLHIRVDQKVNVNTISILGDLDGNGNLKFVIFNADTSAQLYVSAAKAFVDDGLTWKQSNPFSFTLQAGTNYDIGAIADVSCTWAYDTTAETQNGITSLVSNPNFSNFANPQDTNGHFGVDAAIRIDGVPSNVAPTVALPGGAVSYIENATATVLDTGATATDSDSANFDTGTLTVNFSANGTVDDRLLINNQGTAAGQIGVSGSNVTFGGTPIGTFTGGVGTTPLVITFNSSSSPTAAQALLRNLGYSNVSDAPATTARTISVVLTDGDGGTSTTATKTINVTNVNDAPTGSVSIAGTAQENAILTASNTLADADGLGTITYQWQQSTDGTSNWSNITGATNSTLTLNNAQSGKFVRTQASYTDLQGTAETVASAATSRIANVNDPPTLTGNATLTAVAQNTTNPSGSTITNLFGGLFSDPDTGASLNGLAIIGNTANSSTQGQWQYSIDGTTWASVGTVADGATALALSASTLVRFVPVTGYNGTPPGLTVRALDNSYSGGFTTGTTPVTVDTTSNGGTTAIAGTTVALNTSVNDAPSLTGDATLTAVAQNTTNPSGSAITNLFGSLFSDINTGASLNGLAIVGNTANSTTQGQWQYLISGTTTWANVGVVADGATALALSANTLVRFRFLPVTGYNGTPPGLTVRALDNSYSGGFTTISTTPVRVNTTTNGASTAIAGTTVALNTSVRSLFDLLWRFNNSNGLNAVWQLDGFTFQNGYYLPSVTDPAWQMAASTADFNHDGIADILWRNQVTGANTIWEMNSTGYKTTQTIPPVADLNWQIAGTANY